MIGKDTVLIAGNFLFPDRNAAGKRVLGLGYIFKDLGYNVIYAGCDINPNGKRIIEKKKIIDGFVVYNFNGKRTISNILNIDGAFYDFKKIIEDIGLNRISFIIIYGSPTLAFWVGMVIDFCKFNNICVIFDCVDWIEKSGFNNFIVDAIKYLDTNLMKRYYACKSDGVICISSYLYNYYKKQGIKAVVIPPVGKVKRYKENEYYITKRKCAVSPIRIVYAGAMPMKEIVQREKMKDRIDMMIELMHRIQKHGISFVFDIYGIEREQYEKAIPEHVEILSDLEDNVHFHGRVPNSEVCKELERADFSILIRTPSKVTTAGFPSKVTESLLMGTPVLANDTSDIGEYITDFKNGIIINYDLDVAEQQIVDLFKRKSIIVDMKIECRTYCCFDYIFFKDKMKSFLEDVLPVIA